MRSVVFVCALALACLLIPSCKSGEKAPAAASAQGGTYTCASCKDAVVWSYNSKGLPSNLKQVEHACPMCKMTWSTAVNDKNRCAECAKKETSCPVCQKAGH